MRRWRDEVAAVRTIKNRLKLDNEAVFAVKLKSPAQIEKVIGKAQAWAIEDLWEKTSSGTNLVRLDATLRDALPPSAVRDFQEESNG